MKDWPKSLPDYQWPAAFKQSPLRKLQGWMMAGVFHAAHLAGRAVNRVLPRRNCVLVIRTDGIGDAVLFEPALESLARTISPRYMHLWAPMPTCELLRLCPSISRMRSIPRGFKDGNLSYFGSAKWRMKMGFLLGRWKFEKVIYPVESPEPLGNWLFCSARARERWLNAGDTVNQFESQRAAAQKKATRILENRPGSAHELIRNEYLAVQWAAPGRLRTPRVYFSDRENFSANVRVERWRVAASQKGAQELIGVVPSGTMMVNSYPTKRWITALRRLWVEQRACAVLLGGVSNESAMRELSAALDSANVPNLQIRTGLTLGEMSATLGKLDGLLSVDTGLAHIAVAQKVPTVVLSAGGYPARFFPWPSCDHNVALTVQVACAGCNNRCHLQEAECVTGIDPHAMVSALYSMKQRQQDAQVFIAARRAA